jgi:DNA-binding transcriptional ArsR family regulator
MVTSKSGVQHPEMDEINVKLEKISQDLQGVMTMLAMARPGQPTADILFRSSVDEAEDALNAHMVKKCDMRPQCHEAFKDALSKSAELIGHNKVTQADIAERKAAIEKLREGAPYPYCEKCFEEVNRLFGRQLRLMQSLRIYHNEEERRHGLEAIAETAAVDLILEPLANKLRLQMLKSLAMSSRSFSELSQMTHLRGGNLLFHLQKLESAGLIMQKQERGEYLLTEKGLRALYALSDLMALQTQGNQ